jgi:aerobic C4-dicarboxylate transport protein
MIGSWTKELDRAQADRVLGKLEPFDERTMLSHSQVSAAEVQRSDEKAAQVEVLEGVYAK